MSGQIRDSEILENAPVFFTLFVSYGCFVDIYAIFFGEEFNDIPNRILLLGYDGIHHKIAHNTDSDGTFVIPECMCRDTVISTRTSFIELSSLPNEVVVPDITPATDDGVVVINTTHESKIVFVRLVVLCGMMDSDVIYLFGFFYGPNERMITFALSGFDRLVLFSEIGCKIGADIGDICFILESGLRFRDIFRSLYFLICLLPKWTILVSEGFIGSPFGSFDNVGTKSNRFCHIGSESDPESIRIGIQTYE